MNTFTGSNQVISKVSALAVALALASGVALAQTLHLKLSGDQEVPAVKSGGSGSGDLTIGPDGAISGSVTATGFTPTAAHIHEGAAGKNGPVIVPFTKEGDKFVPASGAKLTADQLKAFKAGGLYVNVHSAAHPGGEVRAQLKP